MKDPKGPVKAYKTPEEIAKKHHIPVEYINQQVKLGIKVEQEHTSSMHDAKITALQHLDEFPDYYTRLKKMEKVKESLDNNKKLLSGKKYCKLCNKYETESECSYGPAMWKKYSIATIHPGNISDEVKLSFSKFLEIAEAKSAAWQTKEGKNPTGGLNEKGRKSYENENPGSDLKAPSKTVGNPRRASFCARMSGMKKKLTSKKTANDPNSRINKSLRAWNC